MPYVGPEMSPVGRAGWVTEMNGLYEKYELGTRDEKRSEIVGTSSFAKYKKQIKHGEAQKF